MLNTNTTGAISLQYLTELVYELLDAHGDTMALARELLDDPAWAAHANYLQGLHRVGHTALAQLAAQTPARAAQAAAQAQPAPARAV